jgi:signal transduction histidine kinase
MLGLALVFIIVMASFLGMRRLVRRYEHERDRHVSQIEKHAREIEEANARLRELQESKNRLYAHLSHDLRAPLNSVVTACDLLKMGTYGPITEQQVTAMDRVIRNAEVLVRLIDQILQLTKLETGRWPVEVVPFRLETVIDAVLDNLRPLAEQKGIALGGRIETEIPILMTDHEKTYLILQNLVGNALKFTDQGEVEVRARIVEDDQVEISVRDTGPGIPVERQEQIFQPFAIIKDREARHGVGLGLSITRELTHLVGGVISVDSEVGRGSTFTVRLPTRIKV